MSKTRKTLIALFSVMFMVCVGLFTLTACGGSNGDLSRLKITKQPDKTVYVAGSTFDPTGMEVTAYYKGKKEETSKVLDIKKCDIDTAKLTVPDGEFEVTKGVKISYTEKKVSKSVTQTVTVTNKIVSIDDSKTVLPTTVSYFLGQKFDPTGMKITATLEDGNTREIEVTRQNATFNPSGALKEGTTEVSVSIGGKTLSVPVSMRNALFVEAETGYKNGAAIDTSQDQDENSSAALRTDASEEKAKEYVEALYVAHLKAEFAVSEMKKANAPAAGGEENEGVETEAETIDFEALATTPATAAELKALGFGNVASQDVADIRVGGEIISKLYVETVKWLKDANNAEAIEAYLATEEYENALAAFLAGTNEDKDTWDYEELVKQFTASKAADDTKAYYLGQINPDDSITFFFTSDKAEQGSVQFRLASAYLYVDNGDSWTPGIMADMPFNDFFEVYVNGVKQTIGDDLVLEGGKTEDGSYCQGLWINWFEVEFQNVDFAAGRNVIELKIKSSSITNCHGSSFACNVDTLIVSPNQVEGEDVCKLGLYDLDTQITVAATAVKVEKVDANAILTVNGTYSGVNGYVEDMISALLGNAKAEIVTNPEDSTFTASFDATELDVGEYALKLNGTAITLAAPEGEPLDVGYSKYSFKSDNNALLLVVESDAEIYSYKATGAKLEQVGDDVYFVVTGEVSYKIYEVDDVGKYLNRFIGDEFDFQGPLTASTNTTVLGIDKREVTAADAEKSTAEGAGETDYTATFTLKINLTKDFNNLGNYATHLNGGNLDFLTQAEKDEAKPDTLTQEYKDKFNVSMVDTTAIKVGHYTYSLAYEPWYSRDVKWGAAQNDRNAHFYGSVGLVVETDQKYTDTAKLVKEGDKVYLVFESTYENYTLEEVQDRFPKFADIQELNGSWNVAVTEIAKTVDEEGLHSIYLDITNLALGAEGYFAHHGPNSNFTVNVSENEADLEVFANGKQFMLSNKSTGDSWQIGLTFIQVADATQPIMRVTSTELAEAEGQPVMIIKGWVMNWSNEITFDIETVHDGSHDESWDYAKGNHNANIKVEWSEPDEDGTATFVVTWDLKASNLTVGCRYWIHFKLASVSGEVDLPSKTIAEDKIEVTVGDVKYSFTPAAPNNSPLLNLENAPAQGGDNGGEETPETPAE